jgi:microcystin-dependent protein
MAVDFPSSPTLNELYTYAGRVWKWNGKAWESVSSAYGPSGIVDVTAPITNTGTDTAAIIGVDVGTTSGTVAAGDHTHDDRYYTESEMDAIIAAALAASVPVGTVSQTARASAPTGYLICDGSAVSRTTYSDLFDAIGTAYGVGDNSTTFNIPNLKGKVPVGRDSSQTEFDTLGETGGEKTVALSEGNLPSHSHSMAHTHTFSGTTSSDGNHAHNTWNLYTVAAGGGAVMTGAPGDGRGNATDAQGTHSHTYSGTTSGSSSANTGSVGSGTAHNNLQPYVVLNYIIKT